MRALSLLLCLAGLPLLMAVLTSVPAPAAGVAIHASPGGLPLIPADTHPKVDFDVPCQECHTRRSPSVVTAWESSKHAPMVSCAICHGDGEVEFYKKPPVETCNTCHAGKQVKRRGAANNGCAGCHDGHSLKYHD
jgi:hypothetical protein